jgi:hypothetical protein
VSGGRWLRTRANGEKLSVPIVDRLPFSPRRALVVRWAHAFSLRTSYGAGGHVPGGRCRKRVLARVPHTRHP